MKGSQFLIRTLAVVACLMILDLMCHPMMDALRKKALQTNPDNYEMTSYYGVEMASEELLVLGASTATHHYIPSQLQDSLHLTARNLGKDGASLYCQICQLSLMLERHVPRVIIWDVSDDCLSHNLDWSDFMEISDYWPYRLNAYSKSVVHEMGTFQPVSLLSWLYRYNSKLPEYLFSFVSGRQSQSGYVPLFSDPSHILEKAVQETPSNINPQKVELLEKILTFCIQKGVLVVLATSPRFVEDGIPQTEQYRTLTEITERLGIPYFNEHEDRLFDDASLFRAAVHLNETGAALYTNRIIEHLRPLV